ncbi:MAG: 2-phospho-L-lactate/phosphoenolpyruvate guanylyltransferase [Solirubrobacteraceae bacterium]|nr:2-phospho-L-lactate/phosphoenolpyruvate guanylyltransferase [Solirubrobacteraceae bacterium]
MRTAAVLPVKRFGSAKQRLAPLLGTGSRHALAQAMFQDVLSSLRKVDAIERVVIVASEPSVEFAADEQVVLLPDDVQDGQSAATATGIRWAMDRGFDRVLLVPGDTPLLVSDELTALLDGAAADGTQVVIVPDRHEEGTNALLMSPPDAIQPSFGPGSLVRHRKAAEDAGVAHRVERVPSLGFDVDTEDDLAVVAAAIEQGRVVAQNTRGALRQLDRAGARHPAGAET